MWIYKIYKIKKTIEDMYGIQYVYIYRYTVLHTYNEVSIRPCSIQKKIYSFPRVPRERRRSRASRRSSTNAPRSRRTSGSQLKSLADIGNFNGKSEMEKMGGKAIWKALVKILICLMNPLIDHIYFMILEHVFPVWWAMFAVLRISCKMRRSEHDMFERSTDEKKWANGVAMGPRPVGDHGLLLEPFILMWMVYTTHKNGIMEMCEIWAGLLLVSP